MPNPNTYVVNERTKGLWSTGRGVWQKRLLSLSIAFFVYRTFAQEFSPCGLPPLPPALSSTSAGSIQIGDRILSAQTVEQLSLLYRNVVAQGAAGVAVLAVR